MKNLSLVILLCVAQAGFAAKNFQGFYVKGGLGATQGLFDVDQDFTYDLGTIGDVSFPLKRDFQSTSFAGMLGFGYSYQVDSIFVLSAEFAAQFTNVENSTQNSAYITTLTGPITASSQITNTLKNDFSLLLKPGIITQGKTLFYALLGPRWGNFESTIESEINFADLTSGSGSGSNSGYVIGFTAGVGVERIIADGFTVALEYSYTSYGNIPSASTTFETTPNFPGVVPTATSELNDEVSANTLMVDISYRFK